MDLQSLSQQLASLQEEIDSQTVELQQLATGTRDDQPGSGSPLGTPKQIVREYIRLLSTYNDTKDAAMVIMARLADHKGVRLSDIMEDLGVDPAQTK